jgi:hypothetical protein
MQNICTALASGAQVSDLYYEMLLRGLVPVLDVLLALCPDLPLGPPEGLAMVQAPDHGWVPGERRRWTKKVVGLNAKYPGYQPGHRVREHMKYGNRPEDDAPLADLVRARISHAKAAWCGDLEAGRTKLQFRDWLPLHLDYQTLVKPVWPDDKGWSEALQLLRLACGLPRFVPTSKKGAR